MDDPGTPFGDMFGRAARMKSDQLKAERPNYERCPAFYRRSLFLQRELERERALPIDELLDEAHALKEAGNARYAEGKPADASQAYERALGCVRYFSPTDPEWRTNGFKDATLREDAVIADTPDRAARLRELILSCYLNIAQCRLAQKEEYAEAIDACTEALKLDPSSAKAYYRRARARLEPLGSTSNDEELAEQDLVKAAALSQDDATIRRELHRVRESVRKQRELDRQALGGMFSRGPALYDPEETRKFAERAAREAEAAKRAEATEMLKRIDDMIAQSEASGDHKKTAMLRREIKEAKHKAEQEALAQVDWLKPSDEMVRDAQASGLDLRDPKVAAAFDRLETIRKRHGGTLPADLVAEAQEALDQAGSDQAGIKGATTSAGLRARKAEASRKHWVMNVSLAFIVMQLPWACTWLWRAGTVVAYGRATPEALRETVGSGSESLLVPRDRSSWEIGQAQADAAAAASELLESAEAPEVV